MKMPKKTWPKKLKKGKGFPLIFFNFLPKNLFSAFQLFTIGNDRGKQKAVTTDVCCSVCPLNRPRYKVGVFE